MVLITIVTGAYKSTYNWGGHIVQLTTTLRPGRRCCRYVGEIHGGRDLEPQNTDPKPDILKPKNDMKPEGNIGNLESKIEIKTL